MPLSRGRRSRKLNRAMAMFVSACLRRSPQCLVAKSGIFSRHNRMKPVSQKFVDGRKRPTANSLMQTSFSTRSTKSTEFDTAKLVDRDPWRIKFHREVAKFVGGYGLSNQRFSPSLRELVEALRSDPKQFPAKKGALRGMRAARLTFQDVAFRAVFRVDDGKRTVYVLALGPHDVAYRDAARRW